MNVLPSPPSTPAVVLARGLGTRMRVQKNSDAVSALEDAQAAAADSGLKAMIPFGLPRSRGEAAAGGRPFLDHVLHSLAESGIRRVGLVLGPEHDGVRAYYGGLETRRLTIEFITQAEPLGTADAVASAEAWTAGAPFLVLNADNLYPVPVIARLASLDGPGTAGFAAASLGLSPAHLAAFGLMFIDARGCLVRVIEKPGEAALAAAGPTASISMNIWRLDSRFFHACRTVPESERGERELPGAVSLAAQGRLCIRVVPAEGPVLDLSRRADIPNVARALAGRHVEL